jgi:hypothetical protein
MWKGISSHENEEGRLEEGRVEELGTGVELGENIR